MISSSGGSLNKELAREGFMWRERKGLTMLSRIPGPIAFWDLDN